MTSEDGMQSSEWHDQIGAEVHALMRARGCTPPDIVIVACSTLMTELMMMPQPQAHSLFSQLLSHMLESMGFEHGKKERP